MALVFCVEPDFMKNTGSASGTPGGKITLFRKREVVKTGIPQEHGVEELVNLLKSDGVWSDPELIKV